MTFPTTSDIPDLVPARMLNEFAYCPRLFYLEWIHGEWADNLDTVEGTLTHHRVDEEKGRMPPPDEEADRPFEARSVMMSSTEHGLIARMDIVEGQGSEVWPVDHKKGKAPDLPEGAWEPERVQLCAQGLVLRENGYRTDGGYLYFAASRKRVRIPFSDELVQRTLTLLEELRLVKQENIIHPPLVASPKCIRCSLVGICLPDEVHGLAAWEKEKRREETAVETAEREARPSTERRTGSRAPKVSEVRRLFPARPDALPLYLQQQGARIGRSGDKLVIKLGREKLQEIRLIDVLSISLFGNVSITPQALQVILDRNIPVCHFSYGGWFRGLTAGFSHQNVHLRQRQFAVAAEPDASRSIARTMVAAKIRNGRVLLRRNHPDKPRRALRELSNLAVEAEKAVDLEVLRGIEGYAGRIYFLRFPGMLKPPAAGEETEKTGDFSFHFEHRNRRPPTDPVNALLSYLYGMLVKTCTVALQAIGFDPCQGFFHQIRPGRPSLALDLMEEFRPLISDSVVLTLINNGEVKVTDFIHRGVAVALKNEGRRKVIRAFERRLQTLVTHPVFGYTISYRRVIEVQGRLLARHLLGELDAYHPFRTR